MKISNALLAVVVLSAGADAAIEVPLHRRMRPTNTTALSKRYVSSALRNHRFEYIVEFNVGTPGQPVEATLDTGSSDLWILSNQAKSSLAFDMRKSSTFRHLAKKFSIQYVSGSASGNWVVDTVRLGQAKVANQQLAIVDSVQSQFSAGVFGIGFPSDESAPTRYANFPASLMAQGLITRNVFALYLNSFNTPGGSILFGALDTSRFHPPMATVPILSNDKFEVAVGVRGFGPSFQALLDSGTTLSYLPDTIADKVSQAYGAKYDAQGGYYRTAVPASEPLTFVIGKVNIVIPPEELCIRDKVLGEPVDPAQPFIFGIARAHDAAQKFILGDTFLRSAYTVFDLDERKVSIAQANNDNV